MNVGSSVIMTAATRVYLWTIVIGAAVILAVVLVFVVVSSGGRPDDDLEQRRAECLAGGRPLSECMSSP